MQSVRNSINRAHQGAVAKVAMNQEPHVAAGRRRRDIVAFEPWVGIADKVRQYASPTPVRAAATWFSRSLVRSTISWPAATVISHFCWGASFMLSS